MPPKKSQAKFDLNAALASHADDETRQKQDYDDLPAGIRRGTAELRAAEIKFYDVNENLVRSGKAGQPYIYMHGTVIEPEYATRVTQHWEPSPNGKGGRVVKSEPVKEKVQGRITKVFMPLCDVIRRNGDVVPGGDNVDEAMNMLRLLGGDNCTKGVHTQQQLERLLAGLKNARPPIRFRFRTWCGSPNEEYKDDPSTNHDWLGSAGVDQPSEDQAPPPLDDDSTDKGDEEGGRSSEDDEEDWQDRLENLTEEELEELQNSKGDEADNILINLAATASGKSYEEVDNLDSWEDVVGLIRDWMEDQDDQGAGGEKPPPAKGETYGYREINKRTGKPRKNRKGELLAPIDCEVLSVNKRAQTVTLLNLTDKKTRYENIPWEELITDED